MTVRASQQSGIVVLTLCGDMDMEEAVEVKNSIASQVDKGCCQIVLDFSRVQHINSTGIGILAERLRYLRTVAGDLRLAGLSPSLQHVFELTLIRSVFRIYATAGEAVQSYHSCMAAA
jgi:anti-sigma B factor antagonist